MRSLGASTQGLKIRTPKRFISNLDYLDSSRRVSSRLISIVGTAKSTPRNETLIMLGTLFLHVLGLLIEALLKLLIDQLAGYIWKILTRRWR